MAKAILLPPFSRAFPEKRLFNLLLLLLLTSRPPSASAFPVGSNIDGIADFSMTLPFVDVVKQSRTWGSAAAPWDGNCTRDADNVWPAQSSFGNVFVSMMGDPLAPTTPTTEGNWTLSFTGQAVVTPAPVMTRGSAVVSSTYNPATDTTTATLVIPPVTENSCNCIMLGFWNASTQAAGPGLRDIKLLQPGYTLAEAGNFSLPLLSLLSRFSVLRFMDWAGTNGNLDSDWDQRTVVGNYTYAGGNRAPWEVIFALANTLGKDLWINVPINASDDYVTRLATLAKSSVSPGLHLYVELSNEVWNWGFSQTHLNYELANASVVLDGDPYHFNATGLAGNGNPGYYMMYRYAWRSMRVAELFGAVYGTDNVGRAKTVRPVWAWQEGNGESIEEMLAWLTTETPYTAPTAVVDSLAVAPYMTAGDVVNDPDLTVDDMLDGWTSFAANISVNGPYGMGGANFLAPLSAVAGYWGLALHAYEGGPDTVEGIDKGPPLWAKANASLDARIEPICSSYLRDWYALGPHMGPLNWFTAGAGEVDSPYGIYTILYDMARQNSSKLAAIDAAIASPLPPITPLIPAVPSTFNASFFAGHPVPASPNAFQGWPHILNYPVTSASAFQAKITVTASSEYPGNATLQLGVGGDGILAPTVVPIVCPSSGGWGVNTNCTAAGPLPIQAGYSVIRVVRPQTSPPWIGSVIVEVA